MRAVSCRDLTKRFGAFTATDTVSFDVRKGEIFGLLGPNGAGKSTTFKMLCGLLKPTSGEAHVVGLDLRRATGAAKGQLGYMAQKFSLYGLLSVRQNLEFSAGVYGLEGAARQARIAEMVEIFGLQTWLSAAPDSLPLGYKQRLALACAVMHRPPVLFLDEPTSGVDPITRASPKDVPTLLYHIKPIFQAKVERECAKLKGVNLTVLGLGDEYLL